MELLNCVKPMKFLYQEILNFRLISDVEVCTEIFLYVRKLQVTR